MLKMPRLSYLRPQRRPDHPGDVDRLSGGFSGLDAIGFEVTEKVLSLVADQ